MATMRYDGLAAELRQLLGWVRLVVDGDPAQPHDPETEFVLTRQRRRAGAARSR